MGLATYDPAFMNTACCRSRITYIDGDKGILEYRGYPIEQLAEHSTYLETAYLIIFGELPTASQLEEWTKPDHRPHDASREHQEADGRVPVRRASDGRLPEHRRRVFHVQPRRKQIFDEQSRKKQIHRLIAKVPTIAAYAYRHSIGRPYNQPDNDLSFTGNFLNMLFRMTELKYKVNPVLERALDVLFILHADHEQNCSTNAMRSIGSSHVDPYSAMAGAAAALYGPLHGGANEAVLRMLNEIGNVSNIPGFIKRVKAGEGRLMGFGHRVYKSYDPRAKIIKRTADEVFEVTGKNPLLDIAIELERIALQDDYFVTRKLYPNVDFYSGLIYQAMGFPVTMFPVLFAIPRTSGGSRSGRRCCSTPSRRSRGRSRSTSVRSGATTCRWTSADKARWSTVRGCDGARVRRCEGACGLRRVRRSARRAADATKPASNGAYAVAGATVAGVARRCSPARA